MNARRRVALALVLVSALFALAAPGTARADDNRADRVVGAWLEVQLGEIAAHSTPPPRASRGLALVAVAMRDASLAPSALRDAAVAGAAATVLAYLYPDGAAAFDELANRERPQVGGRARPLREAAGRREGRTDGSDAVWTGTVPTEGVAIARHGVVPLGR